MGFAEGMRGGQRFVCIANDNFFFQLWSPRVEAYLRVCQPLLVEGAFGLNPDFDFLVLMSSAYSLCHWSEDEPTWKRGADVPLFVDYVDQDVQALVYSKMLSSARPKWLDPDEFTRIVNGLQQLANNRFR